MQWTADVYWRLSSFYFLYFALVGAILPYFSLYLDQIGLDAAEIGAVSAALLATRIFAPSLWGWLADRSGRRVWVIRLGCLCALLFLSGLLVTTSFWPLLATVALFSFFWNAVLPQFEAVTLATLGSRSSEYGRIRLWGSISFVVLVLAGGLLFDRISVVHLPWLLLGLQILLVLGSFAVREASRAPLPSSAGGLLRVLGRGEVLAFMVVCFLMLLSHGPFYTFFSLYLQSHGYSRSVTGLLWSAGVLAEILVFLQMHRLLRRFRLRDLLLASLAIAVLRWLLTAAFPTSLPLMVVAQLMHAATYGAFHAAGILLVARYFGSGHQGQGQALYSAVSFGLGGALGAWLSGLAWLGHARLSFVAAAAVAALAWLIAYRWVRPADDGMISFAASPAA